MIEQEKERTKESWLSIKFLLGVIVILAVLAAGVWGYNSYRLKNITIEGLTRYTNEEFTQRLDYGFVSSLTPLFCLADTFLQKEIPFVEQYEIDYIDRQSARIYVHEKRVTGCVVIMGRYMFFDKDGIIVESSDTRLDGIPVITGLKFDEIVLYRKLKIQKESLFDTILELTRLIEKHNLMVQEISFDSGYAVTLELDGITVMLGKRTSYDEEINALEGILASIEGRKGILDMRNYSGENGEVILKEQ